MMKQKLISSVVIITFITLLSGCQSIPQEHKGAATGAGVGAATGAVTGAVIGKSTKGAVIGALLGALVGGAIGHYAYDKKRTREETLQTYNYKGSQGSLLTIEEASSSPQTARPGDVVEMKMTYAVLNPSAEAKTSITEIREITHNGELVGKPEVRVERGDGTYTSTVPIRLPSDAKKGTYKVRTTVQSETAKDSKEISFTVL
ncbi:MAG: glycine zipper 2TM domain-containing protein [Desulfobacteraceae bacterium]|nr:MAG: glycine zipper 2TM domain-containing protein [Desulfobacteraceae bacterium]